MPAGRAYPLRALVWKVLTVNEDEIIGKCLELSEKLLVRTGLTPPGSWPVL